MFAKLKSIASGWFKDPPSVTAHKEIKAAEMRGDYMKAFELKKDMMRETVTGESSYHRGKEEWKVAVFPPGEMPGWLCRGRLKESRDDGATYASKADAERAIRRHMNRLGHNKYGYIPLMLSPHKKGVW